MTYLTYAFEYLGVTIWIVLHSPTKTLSEFYQFIVSALVILFLVETPLLTTSQINLLICILNNLHRNVTLVTFLGELVLKKIIIGIGTYLDKHTKETIKAISFPIFPKSSTRSIQMISQVAKIMNEAHNIEQKHHKGEDDALHSIASLLSTHKTTIRS